MSQTNIGIQNLAQLNEIIGQRDDINPKQQLKATRILKNTNVQGSFKLNKQNEKQFNFTFHPFENDEIELSNVGIEDSLQSAHNLIALSAVEDVNNSSSNWSIIKDQIFNSIGKQETEQISPEWPIQDNKEETEYRIRKDSVGISDDHGAYNLCMSFFKATKQYCQQRLEKQDQFYNNRNLLRTKQENLLSGIIKNSILESSPDIIQKEIKPDFQDLLRTEDMVNTFYLLNMMIGIGKQYVNQYASIDDSGSFKRPFDNTGSIKRLIDTSGSINKLRFDNYEAIKRPIGNTGLIVVKDELKLPFTISPLSLADVLNAYQDPQSSSSSQTNISSQIDNQSEYILRTSLRLQRGLIEGAKQFYEGLFEDQARKKILEDEHSKRIAQIGSMDITYEQPLSISEQTDQLQTNFNRKNSFIRVAIGLCFLKHSNCQSILSQRSEQESAILDLTLTQKHLAGITQPQTRQQQTNNWPIEFESFTNDGYPLWPIIYFCIRCGKLQDALAILKYNSIEEAEEQLPLLQKEIQELKTIRQSEIIKDPRQDSQNKTSLLTINKSPHSDQHAQLCMNIIKNKIINKNDNYFYKELDRMLSNDSRDNEIEIMEDNGKIKINEDKEKKKQNGNSTEDKNKITNFISDSNDIYKIAVFQILGRKIEKLINKQQDPFYTYQDNIWACLFCIDSEEDIFNDIKEQNNQQSIHLSYLVNMFRTRGNDYFNLERNNPWPYIQMLLATQQFELAVITLIENSQKSFFYHSFDSSQPNLQDLCGGVHLMIGLSQYGLLNEEHTNQLSNSHQQILKQESEDRQQTTQIDQIENLNINSQKLKSDQSVFDDEEQEDNNDYFDSQDDFDQMSYNENRNEPEQDFYSLRFADLISKHFGNNNSQIYYQFNHKNPKQQSIIFLKPSNILSYYVSNVFTFNKPEKQDQQEAAITYCTLSSPNPGYIDEDPALINIAKIISSSNNNSFFEQPQFLSSILTPEAVSKVRQFCANEFSKEKNQAKEINILLQNPDPNDSVAFDRCNQFFETYLLFQPQYEPQRSDVIQMLQKYVDDFILKQKHTDYRISLQHNPIQYKMKLLVDIGNASSSAAEAVRMSQELRSGADINNDVYNNWLSVIQKMDEIDIISLLKEIKSSKSPQYPPECITKNISGIVKIYVEALNFLFRAISIRKYKMNDEQGIIQPINGSIQQMDLQLDEIRNRLKDLLLRFKETKGKNVENYEQVLQQLIYIQTSTQPNQVQKRQQK